MSIPLFGVIIIFVIEKIFHRKFFSPRDWEAASIFGIVGSLVLYPSALGLTHIDTYGWGWASQGNMAFVLLMMSIALIAVFLLWKKNRFGMLLLIALLAFVLHAKASTNFWDYCIDPIYGGVAILLFLRTML